MLKIEQKNYEYIAVNIFIIGNKCKYFKLLKTH